MGFTSGPTRCIELMSDVTNVYGATRGGKRVGKKEVIRYTYVINVGELGWILGVRRSTWGRIECFVGSTCVFGMCTNFYAKKDSVVVIGKTVNSSQCLICFVFIQIIPCPKNTPSANLESYRSISLKNIKIFLFKF